MHVRVQNRSVAFKLMVIRLREYKIPLESANSMPTISKVSYDLNYALDRKPQKLAVILIYEAVYMWQKTAKDKKKRNTCIYIYIRTYKGENKSGSLDQVQNNFSTCPLTSIYRVNDVTSKKVTKSIIIAAPNDRDSVLMNRPTKNFKSKISFQSDD